MDKIAVGMSGGVDSAAAAFLLKEMGIDIEGVTMSIYDGDANALPGNACYGSEEVHDIEDAQRVCEFLGIPHRVIDLKSEYREHVLDYFKREYEAGRTPNPCVRCNQYMKFGLLMDKLSNFDFFATGHYARIEHLANRSYIKKAVDDSKDQSYFLCMLKQHQIKKVLFPLGEMLKTEIRRIAIDAHLPVALKEESQDFTSLDYKKWLSSEEGSIVDLSGKILGRHKGITNYTIGQRKGLDVPAGLYVVKIDKEKNQIIVGTEKELFKPGIFIKDANWIVPLEELPEEVDVKIRYKGELSRAKIDLDGNTVLVMFDNLMKSPTPGQWAVFYDGDLLLGGGVIEGVLENL